MLGKANISILRIVILLVVLIPLILFLFPDNLLKARDAFHALMQEQRDKWQRQEAISQEKLKQDLQKKKREFELEAYWLAREETAARSSVIEGSFSNIFPEGQVNDIEKSQEGSIFVGGLNNKFTLGIAKFDSRGNLDRNFARTIAGYWKHGQPVGSVEKINFLPNGDLILTVAGLLPTKLPKGSLTEYQKTFQISVGDGMALSDEWPKRQGLIKISSQGKFDRDFYERLVVLTEKFRNYEIGILGEKILVLTEGHLEGSQWSEGGIFLFDKDGSVDKTFSPPDKLKDAALKVFPGCSFPTGLVVGARTREPSIYKILSDGKFDFEFQRKMSWVAKSNYQLDSVVCLKSGSLLVSRSKPNPKPNVAYTEGAMPWALDTKLVAMTGHIIKQLPESAHLENINAVLELPNGRLLATYSGWKMIDAASRIYEEGALIFDHNGETFHTVKLFGNYLSHIKSIAGLAGDEALIGGDFESFGIQMDRHISRISIP